MLIEQTNTRRFRHVDDGAVLAIYDSNRSFTIYADVCYDFEGRECFDVATARTYWDDEIEELR